MTSTASIITLLKTALLLLSLAQGPNVPQALHDQAVKIANTAIAQATAALGGSSTYSVVTPQPTTPATPTTPPIIASSGGGGGGSGSSNPGPIPVPIPTPVLTPTVTPTPAPAPICSTLPPQTQTLACPTGQTGSITQTRTSSCATNATSPVWSDWQTANTCITSAPSKVSLTSYPNFQNLCYTFVTGYDGNNTYGHYAPTCTDQTRSSPFVYSVTQEVNGGHVGAANNSAGRFIYMNDYDYDADFGQWLRANFYPSGNDMIYGMALDTANFSKTNVTGWPLQQGNLFFGLNDISTAHANATLDKDITIEFDMRIRGDDINNNLNPGTYSGHRIMLGTLLDWTEQGGRTNRAHYFEVNFAQTPGYATIYHDKDYPLCHDLTYDRCAYDDGAGQWAENRYVPYAAVSGMSSNLITDQWVHIKIPLSYAKSLHWVSAPASWANATFAGLYIGLESTGATRYWIEVKNYQVYYL